MSFNVRQQILYNYLEQRGDQWTTQEQVAKELMELYDTKSVFFNEVNFHDSKARHIMTRDIQIINESDHFPKIIISGAKGIKLANEKEFSTYIKSQYASVFRRLKRVRGKERKGNLNGQTDIFNNTMETFLQEV